MRKSFSFYSCRPTRSWKRLLKNFSPSYRCVVIWFEAAALNSPVRSFSISLKLAPVVQNGKNERIIIPFTLTLTYIKDHIRAAEDEVRVSWSEFKLTKIHLARNVHQRNSTSCESWERDVINDLERSSHVHETPLSLSSTGIHESALMRALDSAYFSAKEEKNIFEHFLFSFGRGKIAETFPSFSCASSENDFFMWTWARGFFFRRISQFHSQW